MKQYLQIHLLTSYPPANLNRDDMGRPKTAVIGGTTRLRISSQSLKRAWRTSDVFQQRVGVIGIDGDAGLRTKRFGQIVYERLVEGGIKEKSAMEWARAIAGCFGAIKKETESFPDNLHIEQLAFLSPEEQRAAFELVETLIVRKAAPSDEELKLLRLENSASDVALFGRMLAKNPSYNVEAAIQVAHAFSVQKVVIEDDFFTAVDDLNKGEDDLGAGHMGDTEFASGVFYTYVNIDRQLLLENLAGSGSRSEDSWKRTIQAIVESAAKVAPTGKQNTFGSRAYAHYILAELGDQQPRSLALAFVDDVKGDILMTSIDKLETMKERMDAIYGACSDESIVINVLDGRGTFSELEEFCIKEE
ncbi:MAG TPA: type I-E CRISPR-associated protein Cas7/Cse4/CasC [Sphaerochaeta sp.]|jgi:CRISPR system Cascade subunit CasC|nr:type I-E CRISPR-associated protein Cas7/Cse4/CasC [Sphaerochaeta sp.]HPK47353.1 type I-E CRISPR-associated protein Cas7/Cse4/CasC [Sphaerochaeta sp.]